MRHRLAEVIIGLSLFSAPLRAQDSSAASTQVPAAVALRLVNELELDETQVGKLRALAKAQGIAMSKATSAYLRAEADVLDAARGEDLVLRRTALEKRAKVAIDGEMARLKAEKDTRAVLTAKQSALYSTRAEQPAGELWNAIVAPTRIALAGEVPVDSGEVRVSVTPNYADIYVGGEKRGTGRRFIVLPVGKHELKLHALGCTEVIVPIEVTKGPAIVVTKALTCGK